MKTVFLTGSTGMLGQYVRDEFSGADYDVIAPTRAEYNLEAPATLDQLIIKAKPNIVIHLSAQTDVDLCERDPVLAMKMNSLSTQTIARAAKQTGAWLLYISSSNVYGREGKSQYNELDIPGPLNYYGLSKLAGEAAIRETCGSDYCIVRAGWMIGGGRDRDHKFVGKLVKQIRGSADKLLAVDDKYGTITPAYRLAKFVKSCADRRLTGLYHYASLGSVSRYDIAKVVADHFEFKGKLIGVRSNVFPLSAPRPSFEGITTVHETAVFLDEEPNQWRDDLTDYISKF